CFTSRQVTCDGISGRSTRREPGKNSFCSDSGIKFPQCIPAGNHVDGCGPWKVSGSSTVTRSCLQPTSSRSSSSLFILEITDLVENPCLASGALTDLYQHTLRRAMEAEEIVVCAAVSCLFSQGVQTRKLTVQPRPVEAPPTTPAQYVPSAMKRPSG